jgi:esterase/lipase superfamily enzyme
MKTKTFDCVKMKRKGAEKIYRDLKDKTVSEQVEYWRQRSEDMRRWQEARKLQR